MSNFTNFTLNSHAFMTMGIFESSYLINKVYFHERKKVHRHGTCLTFEDRHNYMHMTAITNNRLAYISVGQIHAIISWKYRVFNFTYDGLLCMHKFWENRLLNFANSLWAHSIHSAELVSINKKVFYQSA